MTRGRPKQQGFSLSPRLFLLLSLGLVAGVMAIIWYSIPGPDNQYRFVAPSGNSSLELAELCGKLSCDRVAIYERRTSSGERIRTKCDFTIDSDHPVFTSVVPKWSDGETNMSVEYSDADAVSGSITIDFEQSCK